MADYDRSLELDPTDARGLNNRCAVLLARRRQSRPTDYNDAISMQPELEISYLNRGNLYVALGRFDEALDDINHGLALSPRTTWACYPRPAAGQAEAGRGGPGRFQQGAGNRAEPAGNAGPPRRPAQPPGADRRGARRPQRLPRSSAGRGRRLPPPRRTTSARASSARRWPTCPARALEAGPHRRSCCSGRCCSPS